MTSAGGIEATALPALESAREPAWVREGSASVQRSYQEGLGFEELLTEQLTSAMLPSGESEGEGEGEEGHAAAGTLSALGPQALAGAIERDGGLGLAAQLAREQLGAAQSPARSSGGTAVEAGG